MATRHRTRCIDTRLTNRDYKCRARARARTEDNWGLLEVAPPAITILTAHFGSGHRAPQDWGKNLVSEERPGYYRDVNGEWHKDRRKTNERRLPRVGDGNWPHHDRRLQLRRKTDSEFVERDAQEQILDALDEFAAKHDAHGHPIEE